MSLQDPSLTLDSSGSSSGRLKVMTIVGTRPELIKLSRVIAELEAHTDHLLVHTGQNYDYELNGVFFEQLEIRKPDFFLEAAGSNAAETIGQVITKSDAVLAAQRPDAVLIYGDTNSCLSAISAKRRQIPVFHMEAGNRCFDQRVPEEINRKILDHICDINLPLTEHARRYLLAEGLRPETVIKSGSTMPEVLEYYRPKFEASGILEQLKLKPREYFVVSAHREENVDRPDRLEALFKILNQLAAEYNHPVIVSVHPRTRARIDSGNVSLQLDPRVQLFKAFGLFEYLKLQTNARCVLSDSGTITEESSILDFPAIMIREAHERPEGMDVGTLVMSGLNPDRVLQAVRLVTSQRMTQPDRVFRQVDDYRYEAVSKKIVRIIHSYVDYVNRTVWRRSA